MAPKPNSTSDFDTPCLPCVKGRQRAAPHSSSFPPMTAPLQTLHVDVKGEVHDVLIPWIRAVRLQLRERFRQDLPVLRLHFDRGDEFSSDLLRDFCYGEGILQSFTLLASPQKNGIAERRIGLVMEVARTSMIHAAAPHFQWPFAVWYAAHQLNLWPCVSLPETSPTLRWTGKVGDASVFRGPGPSGVSQVDPLPRTMPVEVVVDSSAARGAATEGAASGGAEPARAELGGAEPAGAKPGSAESKGVESGGAEPGGAELEGAEPRGTASVGGLVGAGAGDRGAGGAGAGGARAGGTGAGGTVQWQPFFIPPPSSSLPPPDSVLCQSRPASLVCVVRTGRQVPRPRPPLVPSTHIMALRPSSVPVRVPLPPPHASSLPAAPNPKCDLAHAANPTVPRLLATAVSSLVAELVDFVLACRLDYATSLVAESESDCSPSVGDAPNIPTMRSYAEAITGPYSSQWQTPMDGEMASWKSTGTYVDVVPPFGANNVDDMWIFRVKRSPGSLLMFKARYVARGFTQRQGVDFFQTFSPTPKITTLWVLLHVAAQRDYELHSLDLSTTFL
ncbi:unnamed protein product [Closterium sp. NIES-54]